MKVFLLLTVVLGLALVVTAIEMTPEQVNEKLTCSCGVRNVVGEKIIEGESEPLYQYTWMVSIIREPTKEHFCGGTIITPWHVLTTATCTKDEKTSEIAICVGAVVPNKCGSDDNSKLVSIAAIQDHNKYNPSTAANDISLLVTVTELTFNNFIGPACMYKSKVENDEIVSHSLMIMGWGDRTVLSLRVLYANVITLEKCMKHYPKSSGVNICTYSDIDHPCRADGGGPVLRKNEDLDRYFLAGLVSSGPIECNEDTTIPSLNTNVSIFIDWILEKIKTSQKSDASVCNMK